MTTAIQINPATSVSGPIYRPAWRTMAITGAVFSVLSTGMPLSLDASASTRLTLVSLHLVVGAIYVAGVAWLARFEAKQ